MSMDTDWWDLVPDFQRTPRIPEPLLAVDGRVFLLSVSASLCFRLIALHRAQRTFVLGGRVGLIVGVFGKHEIVSVRGL